MALLRTRQPLVVALLLGALAVVAPGSTAQAQEEPDPSPAEEGAADAEGEEEGADEVEEAVPDGGTPDRDRARVLASEGMDLIKSGETEQGIAKLEEALDLVPVPTIALATADAMLKVGRYVDALRTYREASSMAIPEWIDKTMARMKQQLAKDNASRKIPPLLEKMPKVRITVIGLTPERVTIDGEPRELAELDEELFVDPGVHVFEAAAGSATTSQNASVDVGKAIAVTLKLDDSGVPPTNTVVPLPPSPTPAPPRPVTNADTADSTGTTMTILGWVAVGLGGGALGAMAGTWIVASGKASDLEAGCTDGVCDPNALGPEGVDDLDSYNTLRTTTIILGVAGGVLAATGVTLLLTAPSDGDASPEVALDLGPMHAGVHGRF